MPQVHPDSYKAYAMRRIDRLYRMADTPSNEHERQNCRNYLEEIQFLRQRLDSYKLLG